MVINDERKRAYDYYYRCQICKQTFLSTRSLLKHVKVMHNMNAQDYYMFVNKIEEIPKCPVCGNDVKFISYYKGFTQHCSAKCRCKKNENSIVIKRGTLIRRNGKLYLARHHIRIFPGDIEKQLQYAYSRGKLVQKEVVTIDDIKQLNKLTKGVQE